MAEYATEQKKVLLEFLTKNRESAYTVEELSKRLTEFYKSNAPGKSTVYRLITKLVSEGKVRRFVKGHSRSFVYQIIDGEGCHSHLHMKCTDCGKLLHLDEKLSEELVGKVLSSSSFSVNEGDTVLFGQCASCKINLDRIKKHD